MRYLRLYKIFIKNCLIRDLEYNKSFIVMVGAGITWVAVNYLFFSVVFGNLKSVGVLNKTEILFLLGVWSIINSMLTIFLSRNLNMLGSSIQNGDLDMVLIRPINPQFFITLRYADFAMIFELLFGVIICLISGIAIGLNPGIILSLLFVAAMIASLVICYSWWLSVMCLTFYSEKAEGFTDIFWVLFNFSKFPDVYRGKVKAVFIMFFPIVFSAYIPAAIFLGKLGVMWGIGYIILSLIFFKLSSLIWRTLLKRYASVGN